MPKRIQRKRTKGWRMPEGGAVVVDRTSGFGNPFPITKAKSTHMGYWTRANTEPCLLATRGKPKRLNADVRQGIIAPRREHSRKPDEIHSRIERLVPGPYLELFARAPHDGWAVWGNETNKHATTDDAA